MHFVAALADLPLVELNLEASLVERLFAEVAEFVVTAELVDAAGPANYLEDID